MSAPPKAAIAVLDQTAGSFPVGDVVGVGDRLPAVAADLGGDLLGRVLLDPAGRAAVVAAPGVVHDDTGTLPGEQQAIRPAEPAAPTRDDRHPSVQ